MLRRISLHNKNALRWILLPRQPGRSGKGTIFHISSLAGGRSAIQLADVGPTVGQPICHDISYNLTERK
jgi:hypothetical protein